MKRISIEIVIGVLACAALSGAAQSAPSTTFREILEMTDPKAFLAKSGWYPGIRLQAAAQ
ncbi:MAG: hypothetical protein ACT4O5_07840 [Gammaproteobacteria bacterium]